MKTNRDMLFVIFFAALCCLTWPHICIAQPSVAYGDAGLPGSAFAGVVPGADGRFYGVTYDGGTSNKGALYRFDPVTSLVTTLHSFDGASDGQTPYGELTFDAASGKFYGTTEQGGPLGVGTVFSFDGSTLTTLKSDFDGFSAPQGALVKAGGFLYGALARTNGAVFRMALDGSGFTIIHAFADFASLPQALTLGADGKLYGVTIYGGAMCDPQNPSYGCGTIFRLDPVLPGNPDAQFQTLFQFQFQNAIYRANYPQAKLVYGSDGYLYGATFYRLFRLDPGNPAATFQFMWTDGGGTSLSVIEGSDGRLYAADYAGGPTGAGRVFSLNKDGTNVTVLHDFSFTTGSTNYGPYGRLYRTATGMVYGTTEYTNVAPFRGTVFSFPSDAPKLKIVGGDVLVGSPGQGIILKSPNGSTCGLLSINNAGALVLSSAPCP